MSITREAAISMEFMVLKRSRISVLFIKFFHDIETNLSLCFLVGRRDYMVNDSFIGDCCGMYNNRKKCAFIKGINEINLKESER